MKVKKLNIERTTGGINLDVDGAPEGIHIEWEILPEVVAAIVTEAAHTQIQDKAIGGQK